MSNESEILLEIKNLNVNYGGIRALRSLNFSLIKNKKLAVIGANGAGKSTLLKSIVGLKTIQSGEIKFKNKNLGNTPTNERVKNGITLVPEGRGVFSRLTVLENLLLGAYLKPSSQKKILENKLHDQLALFPKLKERINQMAGSLSGGEQQMLVISRALMGDPTLLLLDEPSMGLAPILVDQIFQVIDKVTSTGVTLLLVEQNARLALEITDQAIVLDLGTISKMGNSSDLVKDESIREAYLGI